MIRSHLISLARMRCRTRQRPLGGASRRRPLRILSTCGAGIVGMIQCGGTPHAVRGDAVGADWYIRPYGHAPLLWRRSDKPPLCKGRWHLPQANDGGIVITHTTPPSSHPLGHLPLHRGGVSVSAPTPSCLPLNGKAYWCDTVGGVRVKASP